MIGLIGEVIVIDEIRFRIVGNWTVLAKGDLYVGCRNTGYKLGICKNVRQKGTTLDYINPNFEPDPPGTRFSYWVEGDGLDGRAIDPFDVQEVLKLEMID